VLNKEEVSPVLSSSKRSKICRISSRAVFASCGAPSRTSAGLRGMRLLLERVQYYYNFIVLCYYCDIGSVLTFSGLVASPMPSMASTMSLRKVSKSIFSGWSLAMPAMME
jgi:hypothetical protein